MKTFSARRPFQLGIGLTCAMSVLASSARAQGTFQLYDVPDLDQKRDLLWVTAGGTPGGEACMVTTFVDIANYLGSHGFPDLMATSHTADTPYYQDTFRIIDMHDYTPSGKGGFAAYVHNLSAGNSNLKITRFNETVGAGDASDLYAKMDVFQTLMKMTGMPLAMRIVRDTGWDTDTLVKQSQHWFPMTGLSYDPSFMQSVIHTDPASDEGASLAAPFKWFQQSAWTTATTLIQYKTYAGADHAVFGTPTADTSKPVRLIENINLFLPNLAVSLTENVGTSAQGVVAGSVKFLLSATPSGVGTTDGRFLGPSVAVDTSYMPELTGVTDVAWVPGTLTAAFGGKNGAVWYSDRANHTVTQVATLPGAVLGVAGGSRSHDIYAIAGSSLYVIHHNLPSQRSTYVVRSVGLGGTPAGLFYEPNLDRLGVVVGTAILYYDPSLRLVGKAALPTVPGTGQLTVRSGPPGSLFFKRLGSTLVVRAILAADDSGFLSTSTIALRLASAQGFDVDTEGELYVSNGRTLQVFGSDGSPDPTNRLSNLEAGTFVALVRDYDDYVDDAPDLAMDDISADENP